MHKLFFDIESTGLNPETDRIVQLAIMVKDEDDNILLNKSKLYNPTIPISESAFATHGIGSEKVKNCPTFSEDAKKLKKIFEDKIIIGHNIMRFDVPMLMAEFDRAGVEVNLSGKFIDTLIIEKKLNSNKLEDAYFRYTGTKLENAHDALADLYAASVILNHQTSKVFEARGENENQDWSIILDDLYELSGTNDLVDISGKFKRDEEGFLIFNFGKQTGKRIINEESYCAWMLNQSFPASVKKLIREEQTRLKVKTVTPLKGYNTKTLPPYGELKKVNSLPKRGGFQPINQDDIDLPF